MNGLHRRVTVLASIVTALLALPTAAFAGGAPGATATPGSSVKALAHESSGSVIAAGSAGSSMLVVRVSAAGSAGTPFVAGNGVATGVAVQSDGKIVVAGDDGGPVVRRFDATGAPDASFGTGGTFRPGPNIKLNAVAVAPCGQVVIAGSVPDGVTGQPHIAMMRLLSNGTPDSSFAGGGAAVVDPFGVGSSQVNALAVQGDGKVVYAGWVKPDQTVKALVGRLNNDGSRDGSFGAGASFPPGIVNGGGINFHFNADGGAYSEFNGVALDASGRVVVAGADVEPSGSKALFMRFTSAGGPDSGFGNNGRLTPDAEQAAAPGDPIGARSVAIAGGGEIVAAGVFRSGGTLSAALWELTPAGQLDATAAGGGRVLTNPNARAESRGIAVTPDGTIFAGGDTGSGGFGGDPDTGFVTRYDSFGSAPAAPACGAAPPPPPPPPPGTPPPPPPPGTTPPPPPPSSTTPEGGTPEPNGPKDGKFDGRPTLSPQTLNNSRFKTATLRVRMTGPAGLRLTMRKQKVGRISGKICKQVTRKNKNRNGRRCTYTVALKGSRLVLLQAGENRITITRSWGGKALTRGNYVLSLRTSRNQRFDLNFAVHTS